MICVLNGLKEEKDSGMGIQQQACSLIQKRGKCQLEPV
jgi:hypothetical protein